MRLNICNTSKTVKLLLRLNTIIVMILVALIVGPLPTRAATASVPIAAGVCSGYALESDGTVRAWGDNTYGQLGNNSTTDSLVPVQVSNLTSVMAIAGGDSTGYALKADGTVWAWGYNSHGQLGNNSTNSSKVPVMVSNLTGITAIAGGNSSGYALKSDGTVWAWGNNYNGQLGNNTPHRSLVPVQVSNLNGVIAITSRYYTGYALKSDGTVWAWGYNLHGELGNNSTTNSSVPVQVPGLTGVTTISAGAFSGYALKSDGTVWFWGDTVNSLVPVQVPNLTNITAIAGGAYSGYALESDGTVWAWGDNLYGELGDNSTEYSKIPVQVYGLTGVTAIAGGSNGGGNGYALKSDGTVWAWGYNNKGQLGNNSTNDSKIPVQVYGLTAGNYMPQATTFSVSGLTTASLGENAISGTTMTFSCVSGGGTVPPAVMTGADGSWSQSGFQAGLTYQVTPSKAGYTFTPAYLDFSGAGTNINFTAKAIEATNTLQSIAIATPPTKLSYNIGDKLDITGLVVTGTYSDGSTKSESITTANVTGFNSAAAATDQVLTITVGGKTTTYKVQIVASDKLTLTTSNLPTGIVGVSYNVTLSASGGISPYTWSTIGLPEGLSISSSSGVISGTPTADCNSSVTVIVTDSVGNSASESLQMQINPSTLLSSIPVGTVVFSDGNALDLGYANNSAHTSEVMQHVVNSKGIYVIMFSGSIINNSNGKVLTSSEVISLIPEVTYKDLNGYIRKFSAGNGPEINIL